MKHDSTLIIIIAVIILIQLLVFARNLSRIWYYKRSIGDVDRYNIKNAKVPEEFVDKISVREILLNRIPKSLIKENIDEEMDFKSPQIIEDKQDYTSN